MRKCLFVACGPSAIAAKRHRDWGALVTFNRAVELFDEVDIAFLGTVGKVHDTVGHHRRAKKLIPLFHAGHEGGREALQILEDTGRVHYMPYISCEGREEKPRAGETWQDSRRRHIHQGHILGRAAVALVQLAILGYDSFWLFGHDGGHERAEALGMGEYKRGYDKSRFNVEELLKQRQIKHAFWPDAPPE